MIYVPLWDDDTQDILATTKDLPVVRPRFFEKWKEWIIGLSLVFCITVGVLAGTLGAHQCCSQTPKPNQTSGTNLGVPIPQLPFFASPTP